MKKHEALRLGWQPFEEGGVPDHPRVRSRRFTQGRWWEVAGADEKTLLHRIEQTELEIERRRPVIHKPVRTQQGMAGR